jgi:putative hemolysin
MDSLTENYLDKWAAMRREYDARAERLEAEARLRYNDAFDNFGAEVEAAGDWTAAAWDEFTAKVDKKWQELAISRQE